MRAARVCGPSRSAVRVPASGNPPEALIRRAQRQAVFFILVLALAAAALVAARSARPAPGSVSAKQAEAQRVLAQIQEIDAGLDKAVDAYNAAQIHLGEIKAEQAVNARRLAVARSNLSQANANLSERLVDLYTSGDESILEVLLGATSLDDVLDRLDTVNRVSDQDARIVGEVKSFRAAVKKHERELRAARAEQERLVAERAARRQAIEQQLAERRRLLASIKDQIAKIQAAEAARQERLQAEARARLSSSSPTPVGQTFGGGGGNPAGNYGGGAVGIAMRYLGVPYRWGGASPSGFDCSGFIMYVYAQLGVSLPHNAAMQYGYGSPVSRENLQAGDLVFFNGLGHNGMYIGGGQFIHSPHTGDVVKISSLSGWYSSTYVGARRL